MEIIECSKCGIVIIKGMKYLKHVDGTILCYDCYNDMVERGIIG